MNPQEKKFYKLGPAIRNICDELIYELNEAVSDMANNKGEKSDKIRDFKDKIKTSFHPLLKQVMKTLKSAIKLNEGESTINMLNSFYQIIDKITSNLLFLNIMNDVYIFPEFNIKDTIDLIFDGCSNNLKQKLIDSQLLDFIPSKNLYDNNDVRFLLNNDFNNIDYNEEGQEIIDKNNYNILLDKNNDITKNIIKHISNKLNDLNHHVITTKEGFTEDNFKLYLDKLICLKLYNNFEIKFTIAQIIGKSYFILPIEIEYNKQKINLNDKEEIIVDKHKLFSKNDLYFYINKFKPRNDNINELKIESFNKTDFLEKCLLFKLYTDELFNDKFENIKKEIKEFILKYDYPIKMEGEKNKQMEIENIKEEENEINEIYIFYNFSITMKKKNEFYIKLIYNKEYPTKIKMIYSHYVLKNSFNTQNNQKKPLTLILEEKESLIDLDLEFIKKEIINFYDIFCRILVNWISKKLGYIYPVYFPTFFIKEKSSKSITFEIKSKEDFLKIFSVYINEKGKLCYENIYSSKLITNDFKEINTLLTNYLKCNEEDEMFDKYIIQFNDYIKYIIVEKLFKFSEDKIKLIELNINTNTMILQVNNSYNTDKNISTYFEIKSKIHQANNEIINSFSVEEIKIVCLNNKDQNKKIIFICNCKRYQNQLNVEFNYQYENFFRKLLNEIKLKYEICMNFAYEIFKDSEDQKSYIELKKPLIIKENNLVENENENQWLEISNEAKNLDIFKNGQNNFKEKFMKYFKKIKFSMKNNIFKFYLNDKIFKNKEKYSKNKHIFFHEKYSTMIQNIILGYELDEDAISITILEKLKIGYFNKVQIIFDNFIPKCLQYMDNVFKFVDYLLINDPAPDIRICPIFTILKIVRGNFIQHLNIKFYYEKESNLYFYVDGNFNSVFQHFVKKFGEEMILKDYDYNNKKYYENMAKNFFISYRIFDSLINIHKFKISMIEYPFNHMVNDNSNIYLILKDFNIIHLMTLNNLILSLQIISDNRLYVEFRDNVNSNQGNNKFYEFRKYFQDNNRYTFYIEQKSGYNKIIILIDDKNEEDILSKLDGIINIFISLSKN